MPTKLPASHSNIRASTRSRPAPAAQELVSSDPVPMDFVQPGGVALAAVAVPESAYPNSDLASAFFNVSVNKALTAEQCGEFSVPQANLSTPVDPAVQARRSVEAVVQADDWRHGTAVRGNPCQPRELARKRRSTITSSKTGLAMSSHSRLRPLESKPKAAST